MKFNSKGSYRSVTKDVCNEWPFRWGQPIYYSMQNHGVFP